MRKPLAWNARAAFCCGCEGELVGDAGVGGIDAEGGGEGAEVVLLLEEDVAEVLAEGELVEFVGLLDATTVVADGFDFVGEIEAEHVFGLLAGLDGLGGDGGHAAEVVDLVGDGDGVGKLFGGVDGELGGDVHVGRSLEDLGVVDVGDDSLEFALKVFVEEVDELLAGEGLGGFGLGHDGGGLAFWVCYCVDPV